MGYIGNNSIQIDPSEGYEHLKESDPQLLFPEEKVMMAFQGRGGKGRDSTYFTNLRVLIRDVKGLSGKQKKYQSIPYKSIKAFSVETAGSMDSDVELKLFGKGGIGTMKFDFVSGKVDILNVNRFL